MNHLGTVDIKTERLNLRRFRMEDAPVMYKNWASDSEVTKYLIWETHSGVDVTEQVVADWLSKYDRKDYYQWAIEYEGEVIGSISVVSLDEKVQKAHIGYCMGKKWWHRGIMTEALKAVIDFLFDEVGFQRIDARHDTRNPHSGGVMKKSGMKFECTMRRSGWNNQGICDESWYYILSDER